MLATTQQPLFELPTAKPLRPYSPWLGPPFKPLNAWWAECSPTAQRRTAPRSRDGDYASPHRSSWLRRLEEYQPRRNAVSLSYVCLAVFPLGSATDASWPKKPEPCSPSLSSFTREGCTVVPSFCPMVIA